MNILKKRQTVTIHDPLEPKEEEVVEEDEEQEPNSQMPEEVPEEAQEEKDPKAKKAFNPEDFEWTVSDGNPKNLSQVFFKQKSPKVRCFLFFKDFLG